MTDAPKKKPSTKVETNPYSWLAARFWHGMPVRVLNRLFGKGGCRNVGLSKWGMVGTSYFAGLFNSAMEMDQRRRHGREIIATEIEQPPVFIIGHWRSGTTMLHEYLALDDAHTSPTNYECFVPGHCLISHWWVSKLRFLLPSKRPMDNMEVSWEKPQEDEFALMAMGLPSVYRQIAFPNNPPMDVEYLDFAGVSDEDRTRWQEGLRWFLKLVAFRSKNKRIILKTPQHLGRIRVLLEAFPNAKFVHIVRDPYKVFPSTVKLWKSLYKVQAFQTPKHVGLDEYVYSNFERMYSQFERDRDLLDSTRLHELRYEDLVADPMRELESLYSKLDLGNFDPVMPKVEAYLRETKDYQTNKFSLDPHVRAEIDRRWGYWMRPYGYCGETPVVAGMDSMLARSFFPNRS